MLIQTKYFGELEVDQAKIITFPKGILGLETFKAYAVFEMLDNPKFRCLQSIEETQVAFILVNPWDFFKDYDIDISDEELKTIQVKSIEQIVVFNIVTFQENIMESTANLLAPIIINTDTKEAAQIVLREDQYTTKHPIFHQKEGE
ncbi:MAG: flagellar assembly protein FliW [Clostridia bacterium]|nr:flagellar assembly protein FliW [Clostridia bacterium]